ncbi:MAG TPA: phosphatase PAP2 family protein [Pyrinomonadaceae bacterium]|nr:phosphatase PAP2 family protein [Pyrinomonadaceae bacterium]
MANQTVRRPAIKPLITAGIRYLRTDLYPALGLLMSAGLAAAALALYVFAGLAEEVREGDLHDFDQRVFDVSNRVATPALTGFMRGVTRLGSNKFLIGAGACVVLIFLLMRWRRAAVAFLVTMAGAALLNFFLKQFFQRERPAPFFDTPIPESYSFPSGHALLSFCFYGVLAAVVAARLKRVGVSALVWGAAALLVALIGLSRVYLGVHYPSDVLAGYAAALVWVMAVALADRMLPFRRRAR